MAKIKLLVLMMICLLVVLASLAFILHNDTIVSVDFFVVNVSDLTIGIWLMLSFVVGGLLGLLFRLPGSLWSSARYRTQQRKLARQTEQLKRLEQEPS